VTTTIVDYGAGNLRSVQNTLEELGVEFEVTNSPAVVEKATKVILPGVGHFGQMLNALDQLQLRAPIISRVHAGVPFLGICVGLQCLFEGSEEAPGINGLGIFPGFVKRFSGTDERIPHMGWNSLTLVKPSKLLNGLDADAYTYFAHSFYAPVNHATAATCDYIRPYSAVIEESNVYAVQFHPEKSGPVGLQVVRNFIEL
jgi:imidazole glycerol phosphate synthase glutamine amidotransferase subunit